MEETNCSFAEKICGVTFVVNVKSAETAKQTTEEYIKALITKECLDLQLDSL